MSDLAVFAVLGMGQGAMYAAVALALLMVYRGSGVVNLAQATMAAWPALVYHRLVTEGVLSLPVAVVPGDVSLGGPMAAPLAFVLAMVVGTGIGALAHLVVFRPLRASSPLTKLVASVGVTIVLQALAVARFTLTVRKSDPILPDGNLTVFGRAVPADRPQLALVMVALAAGLWALYRYSGFGLATRAAAESEKGAILLGLPPDRLAMLNWLLAAGVGSLGGILLSPIAAVTPFNYSFFVVPALAAALAGGCAASG